MKKILALVVAMLLVLGMTGAFAATIKVGNGGENAATWAGTGPASITVTLPTPYTQEQLALGAKNDNVYHIYKVFDATVANGGISYTVMSGKTGVPTGFTVDANGYVGHSDATELTAAEIAAIRTYISGDTPVVTVTTSNESSFTVNGLEYGYYFIDTTVGTLVTVNSTNPNASVSDKNEIPPLDKKITGASSYDAAGLNAIAQVGTDVEFTVPLTIAKGAKNYSFHDLMTSGLKFNEDVVVYTENPGPKGTDRSSKAKLTAGTSTYTADYTAGGNGDSAYTFKVDLADEYVAAHENQTLYFVYSAKVTDDALTTDPVNNTAWLDYGENPGENHTPKKTVHVYSAKISVYKEEEVPEGTTGAVLNDADGKYYKPLAGAGFILKNADNKYYKFVATDANGDPIIQWVDAEADASQYFSKADGNLDHDFVGLPAGTYTLIEKTVPASYTKAPDQTITIKPATSTDSDVFTAANLIQSRTVENKQGSLLPSTGGIGTTLFYVGGGILVLAAVILLVTKRRMNAND